MSLYLKVLEGENAETLNPQMMLALKEAYLPSLGDNIKCGNSLIGTDISAQADMFDSESTQKINPFDWETEFADIIKRRGFDAVVGNPPYGLSNDPEAKEYLRNKFRLFSSVPDLYVLFLERALSVLKRTGILGYIIPSAWAGGPDYLEVRQFLLTKTIDTILHLPFDVFSDAYIDTTVLIAENSEAPPEHKSRAFVYSKKTRLATIDLQSGDYYCIRQSEWEKTPNKKFITNAAALAIEQSIKVGTKLTFEKQIEIKRGVLFDRKLLTARKGTSASYRYFEGDVYRYEMNSVAKNWIEFSDRLRERPKDVKWFVRKRVLLRRLVNRQQRLMASLTDDEFITNIFTRFYRWTNIHH